MNLNNNFDNGIILPARDFGINEECGILGISSSKLTNLHNDLYYGLYALQHRGQESAGIAVQYDNKKIHYYKKMGLVNEVFDDDIMSLYPQTKCACGHVRYSPSGSNNVVNAQPVVFYGRYGRMAVVHNGNIVNCDQLKSRLIKQGHIFQSSIDAEVIGVLINDYAESSLLEGVKKTYNDLEGAFTFMVMAENKIIAARDKYGLKPLIMGEKEGEILISSESCALDSLGAKIIRDIAPGEIIVISDGKILSSFQNDTPHKRPCIFEYVYLARSDSAIDGVEVYKSRYKCGEFLAKLFKIDADVVAGVPDSAIVSARGYSDVSGIPYIDALSKNRYIGRTFIQPSQSMRENSVKIKLNAIRTNIKDKKLILIDDSIVRGTTSKKIIQLLRQNGAKEVHMLIASPIVAWPCFFGVDMETKDQLIGGHNQTEEEICQQIGADSLHYLPINYLAAACGGKVGDFCTACFNGDYPIDLSKFNTDEFILDLN